MYTVLVPSGFVAKVGIAELYPKNVILTILFDEKNPEVGVKITLLPETLADHPVGKFVTEAGAVVPA
jgi:hypothetical protein